VPADPSNYTPDGITQYEYVVVHTMQGYYNGAISWFQNPDANVSAHFCMRSEDGEVTQMVDLADRAWHVGSQNSFSIGIEHEGFIDEPAWYTWINYQSSARLARWIADRHDIPLDRSHIVGHVELPDQTHTDPGDNWDWDLYMDLIHDVVAEGVVEGVVVDAERTCTLTATADTWLKSTTEQAAALSDSDKCLLPVGSELEYRLASDDIAGHRRLIIDDAGPCEDHASLAFEAFAFIEHFDAPCAPADMAAQGVTVSLDGGASVPVDAEGRFRFEGVAPGGHFVEVQGGLDYADVEEPVELEVYPGARVAVLTDPLGDGSGSGTDTDGWETGVDSDSESGESGFGEEEEGGTSVSYDFDDSEGGCACRTSGSGRAASLGWILLLGLGLGLRRRAPASSGCPRS
jgi:hypothetical protein